MAPRIVPTSEDTAEINDQVSTLRKELQSLSATMADFVKSQADGAANHVKSAADHVKNATDEAASTTSRLAIQATNAVKSTGADLEARIEKNPWNSVLIAGGIGLILGMLSRGGTR